MMPAPHRDPAAKPFVRIRNVTKKFGDIAAVADVSLVTIDAVGPGHGVCVGRPVPGAEVFVAPLGFDAATAVVAVPPRSVMVLNTSRSADTSSDRATWEKVAELPSPITGIISPVLGIARCSSGPCGRLLRAASRRGERPSVAPRPATWSARGG